MFQVKNHWLAMLLALVLFGSCVVAIFAFQALEGFRQSKIDRLQACPAQDDIVAKRAKVKKGADEGRGPSFVFLGDSRMWDWALSGSVKTDGFVLNLGEPGETTPELLCRVTDYSQLKGSWFVVQAGINDLVAASMVKSSSERQRIQEQAVQNMLILISTLKEQGLDVIVLPVVPPINVDPARRFVWGDDIAEQVEQFNIRLLKNLNKEILVLDARQVFFDAEKNTWREDLSRDALHWNSTAYEILSEQLTQMVNF